MPTTDLIDVLKSMRDTYANDPVKAVRGQGFIKQLHEYLADQLTARLLDQPRIAGGGTHKNRELLVLKEPTLFGGHKPKDVDVAVIDPDNGPVMLIGLRSQMSSIGNNALTYYEGVIGECISLQERFPMAVHGYVYLMPAAPIKPGLETEVIAHDRYARMYQAITGREGKNYAEIRGVFDQFAYMVVDFGTDPASLLDDKVAAAAPHVDLRISTFVDRMVKTFKEREVFLDFFK